MFSSKQLSPDQVNTVKAWAAAGDKLADIQRKLREEMEFPVTYMDTRFVVLDLGLELEEDEKPVPPAETPREPKVATGRVAVTMDSIALPGAIVSGKVEFSDGESAIWTLDQTGRPAMDPDTPGYQPTPEDIVSFQKQLRTLIQQSGL